MTIDINQFWTLLSESELVSGPKTQALFTSFSADQSVDKEPLSLAKWLVAQNALSSYQAKILTAGHSGPFRYGNYVVIDRIESGFMQGQFKARHLKTGYPVLLQFFAGNEPEDLETWQTIESVVEQLVPVEHPNLAETFETVVLSNRRFVVSQLPSGETLDDKLPRKSRLPWKKACLLMAQAANGLAALHHQNIVHGAVSPRTIWLEKNGLVQLRVNPLPDSGFAKPENEKGECQFDYLAPECVTAGTTQDELFSRDLYSLGCTLFRIIAGRSPFPEPDPAQKKQQQLKAQPVELAKYELPTELDQLIKRLLNKQSSERPTSAAEVATLLGLLSGKANEINGLAIPISKARDAFRRSLSEFLPEIGKTDVASAPPIQTVEAPDPEAARSLAEARQLKIQTAAELASRRKRDKWKIPAAIAGTLLAISGLVGWLAMTADRIVVDRPSVNKNEANITGVPPLEIGNANGALANLPPSELPTLQQELIDDDDLTLWESPTNGTPIQFSYLPSATKMLFVFRPSEFVSLDEGIRVTQSLGPVFESRIDQLENQIGVDLENISELIVSLHTTEDFEYEPYFIVRTNQTIDSTQLMQNWHGPTRRLLGNQQTVYDSSDGRSAYYVIDDGIGAAEPEAEGKEAQSPVEHPVGRFAFGSRKLIDEVAENLGVSVLPTTFADLAQSTDEDRHVNVLFLRNSLFNEEGQKLMGLENISFNRELGVMIPDDVRGGLLSLHLDAGSYVELVLDKNVDLKSNELKSIMIDAFRSRRDMLLAHAAKIPASPYWDNVRIRYGGMLANLHQNIRWDVEHGEVIANCWLPPMAAHNLIAASEHVMAFSAGTSPTTTFNVGPQSLEELLSSKRDLNIANPPDLNVLMADLRDEIVDDFPKLPFAFNIRLLGGDLEKEGITKNQRPGELVMSQKSVAEILTSIMTSANPDKDISGPNDPNCKLIWVVAEDPQNPGERAVLVTTRKAAAEKSYELPPAFQLE